MDERTEMKVGKENASYVLSSGMIPVGGGQELFVVEWGNPEGKPFMCLHGGPGDSFKASHVALFNPLTDHVIFFDQRGCGESTPSAAFLTRYEIQETNTPAHIIADMEILHLHFGFEKMHLAGGSWGSALALLYAIAHPEHTASMQLWSLYLATREQTLSLFEDKDDEAGFPEVCKKEWQRFISLVPEELRGRDANGKVTPARILEYYAGSNGTNNADETIARNYAESYLIYEYMLCQPDGSEIDGEATLRSIETLIREDANTLAAARIEMTYDVNGTFIEDNYIFNNSEKIKNIPLRIVQGKRDWCTPTKFARLLEEKLGKKCVEEVEAGHLRNDVEMKKALQKNFAEA